MNLPIQSFYRTLEVYDSVCRPRGAISAQHLHCEKLQCALPAVLESENAFLQAQSLIDNPAVTTRIVLIYTQKAIINGLGTIYKSDSERYHIEDPSLNVFGT